MIVFQCPQCGASMKFDPEKQIMSCEYCGSTMGLEEYNSKLQEKGQFIATEYSCAQCGGTIMATDATAATFCSYCGSPVALTGNMTARKAPKKIIPFKLGKADCMKAYEEKVRKSFFAPDWMLDPEAEQKFRGIYMPYYSHEFTGRGYFQGQSKVSYQSGSYDYVDTYDMATPVKVKFNNVVGDASVAFPDTMSYNIGKPDPGKEVKFEPAYFSGFYADLSDLREDRMLGFSEDLAKQRLLREQTAPVKIGGRSANVNIAPSLADIAERGLEVKTDTVMNPVWFMSNRRGEKISYAAVDGADGDVAVDIPIDFKKYLLAAIVLAGVLSAIFNIFDWVPYPEKVLNASVWLAIAGWIISGREYNKLWRRKNGYDDIGAMDDDVFLKFRETVNKPVKKFMNRAKNAKDGVNKKGGCLKVLLICLGIPLLPFIAGGFIFLFPLLVLYAIVKAVSGGKKAFSKKKVKVFKAPFMKRFLRALPFIAVMVTAMSAAETYAENDTAQYAIAFGAILVNILMNFNTVRMQNNYAMRDIPVFTQKRGGDA